jgi:hypothetical protein
MAALRNRIETDRDTTDVQMIVTFSHKRRSLAAELMRRGECEIGAAVGE